MTTFQMKILLRKAKSMMRDERCGNTHSRTSQHAEVVGKLALIVLGNLLHIPLVTSASSRVDRYSQPFKMNTSLKFWGRIPIQMLGGPQTGLNGGAAYPRVDVFRTLMALRERFNKQGRLWWFKSWSVKQLPSMETSKPQAA